MRVTQSSMSRNYINNLNNTLLRYNKSMDKVSSGRRFTKMSESVADGSRALRIRAQLYKNTQMQRNLSSVQEELNIAETNMMSVKEFLIQHEQALRFRAVLLKLIMNIKFTVHYLIHIRIRFYSGLMQYMVINLYLAEQIMVDIHLQLMTVVN